MASVASVAGRNRTVVAPGAAGYLVKPRNTDDLRRPLKSLLPRQGGVSTYFDSAEGKPILQVVPLTDRKLNILLAEDNADDAFFFETAFKKAGGTGVLYAVSDGLEALAYLSGEGAYSNRGNYPFPDVLLLDLKMPRMNGLEVLEWVRQNPKCGRLMVHMLTSSSREADVQRAYELRANGYVVKPTQVEQLVAFVAALHQWHRFLSLPTSEDCATVKSLANLAV